MVGDCPCVLADCTTACTRAQLAVYGRTPALTAALDYLAVGLSTFALALSDKTPLPGSSWRRWMSHRPRADDLRAMFGDSERNIALVCGSVSDNLFVIDAESPRAWSSVVDVLRGAGLIGDDRSGAWLVQRPDNGSEHDGGGHAWLRSPLPVASMRLADDLEIRGERSYVLAPPSLHPGGGAYAFVHRPAELARLVALDDLRALGELRLRPADISSKRIPRGAWRILQGDADVVRRYVSRSECEAACCASLIRAGFTFGETLSLFMRHPAAGKFAELHTASGKRAVRWLAVVWGAASEYVATHNNDAGRLAQRLRAWAECRAWPGRGGSSMRAVYLAHLEIVSACGCEPHDASCRRLAELAGVTWPTVRAANDRLVSAGLIERVRGATATLGASWRLCEPAVCASKVVSSLTTSLHIGSYDVIRDETTSAATTASHDVWRWSALGLSGCEIMRCLSSRDVATVREIAQLTGRSRATVYRRLRDLLRCGMAEPVGRSLWRGCDVSGDRLDDIAREFGVYGAGLRQRLEHIAERDDHAAALARCRGQAESER